MSVVRSLSWLLFFFVTIEAAASPCSSVWCFVYFSSKKSTPKSVKHRQKEHKRTSKSIVQEKAKKSSRLKEATSEQDSLSLKASVVAPSQLLRLGETATLSVQIVRKMQKMRQLYIDVLVSGQDAIEGDFPSLQTIVLKDSIASFVYPFRLKNNKAIDSVNFMVRVWDVKKKSDTILRQTSVIVLKPFPKILKIKSLEFTNKARTSLQKGEIIGAKVCFLNEGKEPLRDMRLKVRLPKNIYPADETEHYLGTLAPNAEMYFSFPFVVHARYAFQVATLTLSVQDQEGEGLLSKDVSTALEEPISPSQLALIRKREQYVADSVADIDKHIPLVKSHKKNTYALVIGNEHYPNYGAKGQTSSVVNFANHDADVFFQYATRTLGIPRSQILLLQNATYTQTQEAIKSLQEMSTYSREKAEILFYYAGHSAPLPNKKKFALLPVEYSEKHQSRAIDIENVVNQLSTDSTTKVTLFLDACFSAVSFRETKDTLVAKKTMFLDENIRGRAVVFGASKIYQGAWSYDEKKHGLFTYCLLKQIQLSKGSISYAELFRQLTCTVSEAAMSIGKDQEPSLQYSLSSKEDWEGWLLH